MKTPVITSVGLAFIASSFALPIGNGFAGISLSPGSLGSFYNQEVTFGSFPPLLYGFSMDKGGTIEAGIRLEHTMPVSAAVSFNLKDPKRTIKFEVGARFLDSLSGIIYGDRYGLKWLTSYWVPVDGKGALRAVGVSLEGDRTEPVALSGGFGLKDTVYQARIKFDKDLTPSGTNILVGTGKTIRFIHNTEWLSLSH